MDNNENKNIKTDEKFLKESLLYQMSLGSKELYHSNVWGWLIENEPQIIKVFFPAYDEKNYEYKGVDREIKHRDLVIWLHKKGYPQNDEKYFYVIENKIKSLPSKEQLENYTEDLWDNKMLCGAFTGIANPFESSSIKLTNKTTSGDWSFVPYNEISKGIREIVQKSNNEVIKSKISQINEYCDIIDKIYNIISKALDESGNSFNYDCNKKLWVLNLRDVFVKLKGSHFVNYVNKPENKQVLEKLCPEGYKLHSNKQSFHNGRATLDFCFEKKGDDWLLIGIQIEGDQYRFFVCRNGTHGKQDIFDKFKDVWFDGNFNKKQKRLFGEPTSMTKIFDSYGKESDEYKFVYQYYTINNQDYENLFNRIAESLKKAKEAIESKHY